MSEDTNVAKKKPKLHPQKRVFLDSSDSDSSVGSFFLKRSAEMRTRTHTTNLASSSKKTPTKQILVTPDMSVVHGRSSATREEPYDHGRDDTTETSRMMDVTRLKKTWSKVIDLTGNSGKPELPGPRLLEMKEQNNVYWTYDPRGVPTSEMETAYYCSQCKCPFHYCAKITFGDVVTRQVEYLLKEQKPKVTYDWLELKFRSVYWNCVHHKMMINSIPFPDGYSFPSYGVLPSCIELVYLNGLFRKYGKVCDENRD